MCQRLWETFFFFKIGVDRGLRIQQNRMLKVSNRDNEGRNLEKDFFREGCRISICTHVRFLYED